MKETTNITILIYEYTFGRIKLSSRVEDGMGMALLKLIPALLMFPFLFAFVIIALLVEEPIHCIFCMIFTKNTSSEVWTYYKKCWGSLLDGMRF